MSPLSLPPRPTAEALKKQAKAILKKHRAGDASCCPMLRRLNRLAKGDDAAILAAEVSLNEAQFALAMDYGFKSWAEMKEYVESLEAMREGGLPLAEGGRPTRWVIGGPADAAADGNAWVFTGKPETVRWEVGGMSWDNYILSAEVRVDRTAADGTWRVQLTGRGTSVYCQWMPGCVVLAYHEELPAGKAKGFTHLARREVDVPEDAWVRLAMKAQAGSVTAYLDGREIVSAAVPCGTQGMPGLLVNGQRNAVVRIRNARVEFLQPTPEQLVEYRATAGENWNRWVARHGDTLPDSRRAGER